jgi:hypothetical protein
MSRVYRPAVGKLTTYFRSHLSDELRSKLQNLINNIFIKFRFFEYNNIIYSYYKFDVNFEKNLNTKDLIIIV